MIIIHALFDIKPGFRKVVIEMAQECLRETPKEDGCINYKLYKSIDDETSMIYVEEWRDMDAFINHLKQPYYVSFVAAREQYLNSPVQVSKFEGKRI